MNKIDKIREACIKANPEIEQICGGEDVAHFCPNCSNKIGRPIRLADVLLAIGEVRPDFLLAVGHPANWNLKDDNLENQSEETIGFIHNLIKN